MRDFTTTADIKLPKQLVGTVIGQEEAVTLARKAAKQRRNLLLIGQPGTGKSLIGQALAEMLPNEKLVDIMAFPNSNDDNLPLVNTLPRGEGIKLVERVKAQAENSNKVQGFIFFALVILAAITPWWVREKYGDVMAAASMISSIVFIAAFVIFMNLGKKMRISKFSIPKLLIDNSKKKTPFLDGTGAQAGALLGDVLHDPLQTFFPYQKVVQIKNIESLKQLQQIELNKLLDPLFEKNKDKLIKKDKYEAFFTEKDELFTLGAKNGLINDVEVLSANRYPYTGRLIKLTTEMGKTLIVTPEHKVAIQRFGKIIFKEARLLTQLDKIITTY